jgi:hypothetical protein
MRLVLLDEIDGALQSGIFTLEIMMSLALPDICAALESPAGETNSTTYRAWCAKWFLRPAYATKLTPEDLWHLRCRSASGAYGPSKA